MSTRDPSLDDLLARIRTAAGGSYAVLLGLDRRVLAGDGIDDGFVVGRGRTVLLEVASRWASWRALDRADHAVFVPPALVATWWLPGRGALLAEIASESTIGLARLRVKPLVFELVAALDVAPPEPGPKDDGGVLH